MFDYLWLEEESQGKTRVEVIGLCKTNGSKIQGVLN